MTITHKMPLFFRDSPIDFPNIIAYYSFNDNANNLAQDNYHFSAVGSPSHVSGKYNNCYSFNGTSDYFVSSLSRSVIGNNDVTIAFWLKPGALVGNRGIFSLANTFQSGNPGLLVHRHTATAMRYYLGGGYRFSHDGVPSDIWTHIAIVRDNNAGLTYFYRDAEYLGSVSQFYGAEGDYFYLASGWDSLYNGEIDELVVAQSAYSQELISSLMSVRNPL